MLNITTDEHGFKTAELNAQAGGRVVIMDFGAEYVTDIGSVSSINSHGLGGNDWIRSVSDIDRHVTDIERSRWLTTAEQRACIEFLRAIAE
ncbi:hypothetical protein [Paenibacillus sp. S150]|uniref:hypothetical protein n=1 Tax=Paenibacillus sp. S150 TaxID=2749826 RepID=UPI001C5A4A9E|nr:hypothetical protein [Paenibacillus sp. S150]MBW4083558.1 hypothetical protein [Paenibacillus sp. S150]